MPAVPRFTASVGAVLPPSVEPPPLELLLLDAPPLLELELLLDAPPLLELDPEPLLDAPLLLELEAPLDAPLLLELDPEPLPDAPLLLELDTLPALPPSPAVELPLSPQAENAATTGTRRKNREEK